MNLTEEARRLLTCEELRGRVPEEVADFLRRVAGLELGTDFHAFTSAVVNDPHHGGGNSWQWRREADNASAAKVRTVSRASAPEVTPDILRIPAGDRLAAIIVYFEDEATGKGRMTVACYGDAWTAWWDSMGERTVRQFVAGTDPGYLSGALLQLRAANAMHREYTWRVAARVIAALQEGKTND